MSYIAKHAADRNEFLGSDVFDHEYHDPQVCTGDTDCPELAAPVPAMPVVKPYVSTGSDDPFTHKCCGGLRPAHTSRCRSAY